jgi:TetR/AcrR family transcriptional regulator, regulator of autoinduction and epiphytic fitness
VSGHAVNAALWLARRAAARLEQRSDILAESPKKRIRREPQVTRKLLLDTAETLMAEEGYAAVSTRRVAKEAGVNAALVHYYYATTDDLFVALHRRMMDATVEELKSLLDCENPLAAYWQFQSQRAQAALGVEFIALANHRKAIRGEIAARAQQARDLQVEMLAAALARSGGTPGVCSPLALAILMNGIARTLVNEESIGIERGHDEVRATVEWAISRITGDAAVPIER